MESKTKAIVSAIAVFLFLSSAGAVLQVNVYVSALIDGKIPYSELPAQVDDSPQRFLVVWENTGSIGCAFKLRVDIYERTSYGLSQAQTVWSRSVPVEPGGIGNLEAYWQPLKSANYTAKTFLYFCNSISNGPEVNLTAVVSNQSKPAMPFALSAQGTEDYVEFRFTPSAEVSSLVFVPKKYPVGWSVDSAQIKAVPGKDNVFRLDYAASIWKPSTVSFDVVSADGRFYETVEVSLEKREEFPIYPATVTVLVVIILILSIKLIKFRRGAKVGGNTEPISKDSRPEGS